MTPLTRRSVLAGSALSGLIGAGTTASAASEVNFSFQQSSAVLLALKMKATLDQPFAAKVPSRTGTSSAASSMP
jgi:hypothetical protein